MKSTIVYVEGELLQAFQQQKECARVIDILAAIDLSALSISIEHKHAIFSAESLLKLYLYRRVKKILIYPELITSLKGQAHKLGLTRFPSKRTFNEFVQKKIDKVLLNTIAALIQQMATQHGVILDVELVKHPVEKKRKEVNRYQKELKQDHKFANYLLMEFPIYHI